MLTMEESQIKNPDTVIRMYRDFNKYSKKMKIKSAFSSAAVLIKFRIECVEIL